MRIAWAVLLGAVGAGAMTWWLAREPARDAAPANASLYAAERADAAGAAQVLYRWRDDAGVVQVTDVPPRGRDYSTVDVAALERRNTIQADPKIAAEAE